MNHYGGELAKKNSYLERHQGRLVELELAHIVGGYHWILVHKRKQDFNSFLEFIHQR